MTLLMTRFLGRVPRENARWSMTKGTHLHTAAL